MANAANLGAGHFRYHLNNLSPLMTIQIIRVQYEGLNSWVLFEAVREDGAHFTCGVTSDDLTGNPIAGEAATMRAFEQRRQEIIEAAEAQLRGRPAEQGDRTVHIRVQQPGELPG